MQLVAADAGKGAGGSANFGGEIGGGSDVIAVESDGIGELTAGDLHAVAGVSSEANHCAVNDLTLVFRQWNIGGRGHALLQLPLPSSIAQGLLVQTRNPFPSRVHAFPILPESLPLRGNKPAP